jgi:hypothetical protein
MKPQNPTEIHYSTLYRSKTRLVNGQGRENINQIKDLQIIFHARSVKKVVQN